MRFKYWFDKSTSKLKQIYSLIWSILHLKSDQDSSKTASSLFKWKIPSMRGPKYVPLQLLIKNPSINSNMGSPSRTFLTHGIKSSSMSLASNLICKTRRCWRKANISWIVSCTNASRKKSRSSWLKRLGIQSQWVSKVFARQIWRKTSQRSLQPKIFFSTSTPSSEKPLRECQSTSNFLKLLERTTLRRWRRI